MVVDEMGRVILPADIRHFLNIQAGDRLDIVVKQGEIRLSPSVDHCLLCHRADSRSARLAFGVWQPQRSVTIYIRRNLKKRPAAVKQRGVFTLI